MHAVLVLRLPLSEISEGTRPSISPDEVKRELPLERAPFSDALLLCGIWHCRMGQNEDTGDKPVRPHSEVDFLDKA